MGLLSDTRAAVQLLEELPGELDWIEFLRRPEDSHPLFRLIATNAQFLWLLPDRQRWRLVYASANLRGGTPDFAILGRYGISAKELVGRMGDVLTDWTISASRYGDDFESFAFFNVAVRLCSAVCAWTPLVASMKALPGRVSEEKTLEGLASAAQLLLDGRTDVPQFVSNRAAEMHARIRGILTERELAIDRKPTLATEQQVPAETWDDRFGRLREQRARADARRQAEERAAAEKAAEGAKEQALRSWKARASLRRGGV